MGCSRMGFNLVSKAGRRNLRTVLRHRKVYLLSWRLIFEDTFMPLVCFWLGHKEYNPDPHNTPLEFACRRCHQYLTRRGV